MQKKRDWRTEPTVQKRQNYGSCVKTRGSRKKEGNRHCTLKTLVRKAKLHLLKKDLQLRYINECPDMSQAVQGMFKETWQEELQEVEQKTE